MENDKSLLAAAEAREAFPIPDTLPEVPETREAVERYYLGEARQAAIARAEAAESLVAGLRGALEEAGDVVHACFCETEEIRGKVCHPSCIAINTALTITPASAGNRTDEETEAANGR
jgi:hypothetical protein